jgi:hypothetical protein
MPDRELSMDGRTTVKAFLALLAAGVALVAAGCGGGEDDEPAAQTGERPAQAEVRGRVPPKLVDKTAVEGGSADERQLLRRVVDGMEKTALQKIEIADGGDAVAIEFTPVSGTTSRRQWDEWIVAGALSRRLQAEGAPAAVAASDGGAGFRARPRVRGNPDPRPLRAGRQEAILKAIRGAVKRAGANLVSLEAHRPYGVAIAVSVSTDDPAGFLKEKLRPLLTALDGHRPRLEGIYLAVLEDRRRLVLEWGSWTRNPAGTFWVRRDLADCSPIRQSGPPGTKPPPKCPA